MKQPQKLEFDGEKLIRKEGRRQERGASVVRRRTHRTTTTEAT